MYQNLITLFFIFCSLQTKASPNCNWCFPKLTGDLVHRGNTIAEFFSGHAGITMKNHQDPWKTQVAHVTAISSAEGKALVLTDSLHTFVADYKDSYYGAKRLANVEVDEKYAKQISDRIIFYFLKGVEYDWTHMHQKGKILASGRWLFDCVGFTERILEDLSYNPTPDYHESGPGWPLTVYEQRDSKNLISVFWE